MVDVVRGKGQGSRCREDQATAAAPRLEAPRFLLPKHTHTRLRSRGSLDQVHNSNDLPRIQDTKRCGGYCSRQTVEVSGPISADVQLSGWPPADTPNRTWPMHVLAVQVLAPGGGRVDVLHCARQRARTRLRKISPASYVQQGSGGCSRLRSDL